MRWYVYISVVLLWCLQPLSTPPVGVFEVKLEKDQHHGLGITIAGYTDQTGLYILPNIYTAHGTWWRFGLVGNVVGRVNEVN